MINKFMNILLFLVCLSSYVSLAFSFLFVLNRIKFIDSKTNKQIEVQRITKIKEKLEFNETNIDSISNSL